MAPHLDNKELDFVFDLVKRAFTPAEILERLASKRARRGIAAPHLTRLRKVLKGEAYLRGRVETRGAPRKLTLKKIKKIFSVRKALVVKANSQQEVTWKVVLKAARAKVDPTTAAKNLQDAGFDVKFRAPRLKPLREPEHEAERVQVCRGWLKKPLSYFTSKIDLIIDNEKFAVPTNVMGARYVKSRKVRGHLRTRSEGLLPGFTKPDPRKHRRNTGPVVNVCAGIINGKMKLWHYLPKRWCGKAAVDCYEGPIARALRRNKGQKRKYLVLEDNDPSGYKTRVAAAAKAALGIEAVQFPRYSPDLNPLDFYLWSEVERRMAKKTTGRESLAQYKARLRRTAMAIPAKQIKAAVACIQTRAAMVVKAKGRDIPRD